MIEVITASPAHVGTIARRLAAIDKLECAVFGRSPKEALRIALRSSTEAWTVKVDGRPEAMMGISPISTLEGLGCPWLLMTDDARRQGRALVKLGREYSARMLELFPRHENWVHVDNAVAIRWLERLGYAIGDAATINGQRMRGFSLCAVQQL